MPSPKIQCLTGIALVKEVGRQMPYNFKIDDDARKASVTPLGKNAIHIEVQDTGEMSRIIDIANDGTMTTIVSYGGERGEPNVQKLFSESTVARAYAFITGNKKICEKQKSK